MSMLDCPKCWNTPCNCGWEYKNMSELEMSKFIQGILKYRTAESVILILDMAISELEHRNEIKRMG